jgi:hypothetical protein
LAFLLVENKKNLPILVGAILVGASLPLLKLDGFLSGVLGSYSLLMFNIFFSNSTAVFLASLIIGIIILGLGISWRIIGGDSTKRKFSKKDVKKIIKTETGKKK